MTLSTTIAPLEMDELCIITLRFFAVGLVQKANSGHLRLPLGSPAMAYALWDRFLKFNPRNPRWPDLNLLTLAPRESLVDRRDSGDSVGRFHSPQHVLAHRSSPRETGRRPRGS
jgi:hypothetical protein